MTAADYHPGPAFDVLGKLRAAEAEVSRLRKAHDNVRRYATLTLDSISVERAGMAEDVLALLDGDS